MPIGKSNHKTLTLLKENFDIMAHSVQGDAQAQYAIGVCYYNGTGVDKDEKEAIKWYQKAAEQGHGQAIATLNELNMN